MSRKVFVYWNFHKKCFSVKDCKTRRVIQHRKSIALKNCKFKVSEAGRQRVLKEKKKNVHAGVEGYVTNTEHLIINGASGKYLPCSVKYNPYEHHKFYTEFNTIVEKADFVLLRVNDNGKFVLAYI